MMTGIQFSVGKKLIDFNEEERGKLLSGASLDIWDLFHEKCQLHFKEKNPSREFSENPLTQNGVISIDSVLSLKDVEKLKSAIGDRPDFLEIDRNEEVGGNVQSENVAKYTIKFIKMNLDIVNLINSMVFKVINKKVNLILEDYFRSYFSINHLLLSRALPDADPIVSFRWHRDAGPKRQTHIMVYLDDSVETGGRTEFLNYQDTQKLDSLGYNQYLKISNRINNIEDLQKDVNIIRPSPKKGDVIIFNATQILHQGIHPLNSHRDVLFLILQPNFEPWTKDFPSSAIYKHPIGRSLLDQHPFFPFKQGV